jgi:putative ABC transport system permease protein
MDDTLAFAWLAITRHRLRSLLAMGGVAIGVCALTSIMSVEQSWRTAVARFFAPMDLETVRVALPAGADWREVGYSRPVLERQDVEAILKNCPAAQSATLMTWGTLRAETQGSALELAVRAVDADFMQTLPDRVRRGRLFSAEEVARSRPVCVLSAEACYWLFGSEKAAVGRPLRLEGRRFEVVGIIAGNRHAGIGSRAVYIPSSEARAISARYLSYPQTEIFVRTRSPGAAVREVENLMRQRLGGDPSRPFTRSLWQVREAALNARARAALYGGLAGACALLTAGIGIAALLFVSVAERTSQIGISRALGASRSDIWGEYLAAGAIISAAGAAVGALASIPAAAAGAFSSRWQPVIDPLAGDMMMRRAQHLPKLSELALSVSWEALAAAVVLALVIGVMAALAPASEAAAIDPAAAISQRAGTRGQLRRFLTCLQIGFGVLVLVVLTSYYSALEGQQNAEARSLLGQDKVSAIADPIAAIGKPVNREYLEGCRAALVSVVLSREKLARLRRETALLTALTPVIPQWLSMGRGGRMVKGARLAGGGTIEGAQVFFTTAEEFEYKPGLAPEVAAEVMHAFRSEWAAVVISPRAREELFGPRDPVGRSLNIAGKAFTVVAVRPDAPGDSDWAKAWVPVGFYPSFAHLQVPGMAADFMTEARVDARPLDARGYAEAMVQLRDALLPMLPAKYRAGIRLSEQIPETTKQFIFQHKAAVIRGAAGALAVLLVALIGLANMLLVSVQQAVRETGVRRAFGAQRFDIALHFLSEGVLLSSVGAGVGLAIGILICGSTRSWAGVPVSVSAFWAVTGATATIVVGALVSLLPAVAAARIHPVEALRYE